MKKEVRTVVYDDELHIEAYRFEGIVQPFPNHFHEYYVIGFMEDGERILSCKNQEYTITREHLSRGFHPKDEIPRQTGNCMPIKFHHDNTE